MKLIRFLLPRLEILLLMTVFWSIAANGPRLLNFDGDLPRHILLGRLIRETGSVPITDTFSFRTVGYPSIPHEWLSQVLLSISNDLLGLNGVVLLTALIVTATWIIVYYEASRRTGHLFALLPVTTLGIAACLIHVLPRPHIFTYLFTAIWIVILERIKADKPRSWWWLPILMLLWVNLHGMFVVGIILWGIYLAGSLMENPNRNWLSLNSTKYMLLGGALSLAATLLSPSGFKIWDAILSLGSNTYITSRIPEYQSANFHLPETWPFILLLLLTLAAFARTPAKAGWTSILLTLAFTGFALYTSRMIPLFAIVVVPVAAKAAGDWFEADFSTSRFVTMEKNISLVNSTSSGIIWMPILLILVVLVFQSGGALDPANQGNVFDDNFFPVRAVEWINQHPQDGPMFNEFDWGGYLLLKLSPRQQIFMDGHTHIYGEALTREYENVVFLQDGWQEILNKYQIKWAIVRSSSPVARSLENEGWEIVYSDTTSTILRKSSG